MFSIYDRNPLPLPRWYPNYEYRFESSPTVTGPTRAEFEELKAEVAALKNLLTKDESVTEKECALSDKEYVIQKLLNLIGGELRKIVQS